jgi:8-oxo-dGTP pyrophosphatase MutT (NUDIX family)
MWRVLQKIGPQTSGGRCIRGGARRPTLTGCGEKAAPRPPPPPKLKPKTGVLTKGRQMAGIVCSNCGRAGHFFRECQEPVTSLGIIAYRRRGGGEACDWLLIRRRDTLGFIEIMRGKYELRDEAGIQSLIEQTTLGERARLCSLDFPELWRELWNGPASRRYRTEYEQARAKFEVLRAGEGGRRSLAVYCAEARTAWIEPEWGFPKGRRSSMETELACALRETWEEAGVRAADLHVLPGEPLVEQFVGSNGVAYRHRYWLAEAIEGLAVGVDPANPDQQREVSAVRWCGLEEAVGLIRPYNAEKRKILRAAAARVADV